MTPIRLSEETRECVTTREAAHHIGHAAQTLRKWACTNSGLLQPVRVGSRLLWRVSELRRLLGVTE